MVVWVITELQTLHNTEVIAHSLMTFDCLFVLIRKKILSNDSFDVKYKITKLDILFSSH